MSEYFNSDTISYDRICQYLVDEQKSISTDRLIKALDNLQKEGYLHQNINLPFHEYRITIKGQEKINQGGLGNKGIFSQTNINTQEGYISSSQIELNYLSSREKYDNNIVKSVNNEEQRAKTRAKKEKLLSWLKSNTEVIGIIGTIATIVGIVVSLYTSKNTKNDFAFDCMRQY